MEIARVIETRTGVDVNAGRRFAYVTGTLDGDFLDQGFRAPGVSVSFRKREAEFKISFASMDEARERINSFLSAVAENQASYGGLESLARDGEAFLLGKFRASDES